MRTEDGCIVQECLNGKPEAFGILVNKYKAGIYAFIYSRLGNFQDAQDVTQDVFEEAYRSLSGLRRWENFIFWLYRIAHNLCMDWIRIQSRRLDREFIDDQPQAALETSSLDSYHESQVNESLQEALDSLSDIYREVLMLYYFGDMSIKDIARATGTSPTAIGKRLSRARTQLKEEMIAMMSAAFEDRKLRASFTFQIVEMIKRIKIEPVLPKTLPWGFSLATGLIIAVFGLWSNLNIISNIDHASIKSSISESKVLDVSELPADAMNVLDITVISNQQSPGNSSSTVVPDLQNAMFIAPQAGSGTWIKKADMVTNRTQLSISEVNGKIYVIGGSSAAGIFSTVEEYDPATDKWLRKSDMPTPRYFLTTSVLNGKIYAIGGEKRDAAFSTVEEYDPVTDKWTKKANLSLERTCLSACTANGKIYAIGGMAARANWLSADVEEYDPVNDTWTKKTDMPTPRMALCTVVLKDKIYAIGGLAGKWPPVSTVEEYDPVSDTWTKKANVITARTYFSAVAFDDKIIVFGGTSDWPKGDAILATTIEEYDPIADKWTEKGVMPTPRMYCPASIVNGKIYFIGGLSAKNQIMTLVEEYDPKGIGNGINFKGSLLTTWGDVRTALNK